MTRTQGLGAIVARVKHDLREAARAAENGA